MSATAFLMGAASASAITITYQANGAGTGVNGTSARSRQIIVASANVSTLAFVPNRSGSSGVPSNINLGDFTLACATCAPSSGATVGAIPFHLRMTDTTNHASGVFVGSSPGVSNASNLGLTWAPLQLGPGTNNAILGRFAGTLFTKAPTTIVAPNAGTPPGILPCKVS
jgi:hypothetical protein